MRTCLQANRDALARVMGNGANVVDLFALLALFDTIYWSKLDELNRSGGRPALATSCMGAGGDFAASTLGRDRNLTREEW